MKILLLSVGKSNDAYIQQGGGRIYRRLARYYPCDWQLILPPKNAASLPENDLKKQEAKLVLALLQTDDFLVLLDERGKQLSSVELAGFIAQKATESKKRLVFLIGGAYGADELIFKRADYTWSFRSWYFRTCW